MPDSFGHPLQLPQILAGFGIDSFIFSRGPRRRDRRARGGVPVALARRQRGPCVPAAALIQQLRRSATVTTRRRGRDDIAERFGPALRTRRVHDVLLCNGEDHRRIRRDLPALCAELERRLPGTELHDRPLRRLRGRRRARRPAGVHGRVARQPDSRTCCAGSTRRGSTSSRPTSAPSGGCSRSRRSGRCCTLSTRRAASRSPTSGSRGASCSSASRTTRSAAARATRSTATCSSATSSSSGRSRSCSEGRSRRVRGAGDASARRRQPPSVPPARPRRAPRDGAGDGRARRLQRPLRRADPERARGTALEPHDGTAIESDLLRVEAAPDGTLTVLDKTTGRRFERLHGLEDEPDVGDLYNFCPVDGAADLAQRVRHRPRPPRRPGGPRARAPPHRRRSRRADRDDAPSGWSTASGESSSARRSTTAPRTTGSAPHSRSERRATSAPRGSSRSSTARSHRTAPKTEWCEPPDPTQHTLGAVALGPLALLTKGLPEYEARPGDDGCGAVPDAAPLRRHDLAAAVARSPPAPSAPARRLRPPTASASAATSSSTRCSRARTSSTTPSCSARRTTIATGS